MRALVVTEGRVEIQTRPDPEPGAGEVVVRVHGAGLNRADLAQRAGRYPAPPGSPPDIPGLEFAGEVVAHGSALDHPGHDESAHDRDSGGPPPIGSRVFGVVGGGAQAELLVVPVGQCAPVPERLDLVAAGAVPEVFVTAHDALVTICSAQSGETMFVPAVGSGVGTAAVQLAKAFGLTSVGSARTADKLDRGRALGLDHALVAARDFDPDAFAAQLTEAAGPIDVALDLVGGAYLTAEVRAAAVHGRIVQIGNLAGARAEIDILQIMVKRLRIQGTVLRPRTVAEKAAATAGFVRDVVPLLADGRIEPVVARVLPLADADAAYEMLAADEVFGKIVLDCR
ncbi:MAG TPA: NAD(P)H-quinone oxidoreductase [Acidimicrobiia bacterium]|nr:NAD(P)H-quinone oxidoreductase [Acidimicrobiia bacterium]